MECETRVSFQPQICTENRAQEPSRGRHKWHTKGHCLQESQSLGHRSKDLATWLFFSVWRISFQAVHMLRQYRATELPQTPKTSNLGHTQAAVYRHLMPGSWQKPAAEFQTMASNHPWDPRLSTPPFIIHHSSDEFYLCTFCTLFLF